jgi:hypothetical protein
MTPTPSPFVARIALALGALQLFTMHRWHAELMYPMEAATAGTISSGFATWSGAAAVRFDHVLLWTAGAALLVLAADYLRLAASEVSDD